MRALLAVLDENVARHTYSELSVAATATADVTEEDSCAHAQKSTAGQGKATDVGVVRSKGRT
jgi:hypothetical protein